MAKMVNAIVAYQKTGGVNNSTNVPFTMFAICLLLSSYIFPTYLEGANLCKSIFPSRERGVCLPGVFNKRMLLMKNLEKNKSKPAVG